MAESATTMRAWQCGDYREDPAEAAAAMTMSKAVSVPTPSTGQVLIEVHYSSPNPIDWNILSGVYKNTFPISKFPYVPGFDVTGLVKELGPGCSSGLKVGDKVVAFLGVAESCRKDAGYGPAGAFAELCVCPESHIVKVPADTLMSAVAGLPSAGLSAYQALFTANGASMKGDALGNVQAQSKVLILGGNRGKGHIAVQLAKQKGAYVATTVPPSQLEWMKELNVDEAINWREQDWLTHFEGKEFDIIYDCVAWAAGDRDMAKAVDVLKFGGQYIYPPDFEGLTTDFIERGRHFKTMIAKANATDLQTLVDMVAKGDIKVHVEKVYPFEQAPEAIDHCSTGLCAGKVVIGVAPGTSISAQVGGA
eukprot:TRINITY_DN1921_c0_g1_i2.p1 TRINITY_DN1921_c0_g1~~TRINITY_DN1921_c0_g1_i2.p1  ORF type:complete len:380 (+),score=56.67 TRINITY_DN1921_c0_g1_i2:50-1141(+)